MSDLAMRCIPDLDHKAEFILYENQVHATVLAVFSMSPPN